MYSELMLHHWAWLIEKLGNEWARSSEYQKCVPEAQSGLWGSEDFNSLYFMTIPFVEIFFFLLLWFSNVGSTSILMGDWGGNHLMTRGWFAASSACRNISQSFWRSFQRGIGMVLVGTCGLGSILKDCDFIKDLQALLAWLDQGVAHNHKRK